MFTAAINILIFRAASLNQVLTCGCLSAFVFLPRFPASTRPPATYCSSWLTGWLAVCGTSTAQYVCLFFNNNIVIIVNALTHTHTYIAMHTNIHINCVHCSILFCSPAFSHFSALFCYKYLLCFLFDPIRGDFCYRPPTVYMRFCVILAPAGLQLLARSPTRLSQINLLINTIWHWAQQNVNIACWNELKMQSNTAHNGCVEWVQIHIYKTCVCRNVCIVHKRVCLKSPIGLSVG